MVHEEVEPILGMLEGVVVNNDYNLTITTAIDFAPILRHLAHTTAGIVPMNHLLEVGEEEFADNPVGSGPFMFSNLIIGDRVELVRFPDYWGTAPYVENLVFRVVPDAGARLIEVQVGTADVALSLNPADIPGAELSTDVNVMRRPGLSTAYIGFNVNAPHISDPRVRQAINYALDTHAIVSNVWMGLGSAANGPINDIVWGFVELDTFETNMDKARELLAQAGYADGFSTSILWNIPNAQRQQVSEMVQFQLAQLNIDVEIISMEWAQVLDHTADGLHDMFIMGWVTVTGDPDYGLFPLFHSTVRGAGGNRTFWDTPELDALLEAGRSETDTVRRAAIYAEVQQIIRDEAPWVFLWQGEAHAAVNPRMRGFTLNPAEHHAYTGVWFE
jgi:peptide/nickel transport system substrate-binding protein